MGRAMTPIPGSRRVAGVPIDLRGRADGAGELAPRPAPGEAHRQVQDDPPHGALDPHGELDQALPQREDRKSTRLNSSHIQKSRMPSSA